MARLPGAQQGAAEVQWFSVDPRQPLRPSQPAFEWSYYITVSSPWQPSRRKENHAGVGLPSKSVRQPPRPSQCLSNGPIIAEPEGMATSPTIISTA
jgi:hypothetical protein